VCVLGFNIGSGGTSVAAAAGGTQSSPTASANTTTNTVSAGAGATTTSSRREVNQDVCSVPGFMVLQWLLGQHPHIPHVYFMMMTLLVGQPVQELPADVQVRKLFCFLYHFHDYTF